MMSDVIEVLSFSNEYKSQVIHLISSIQREFGIAISADDQPDLQQIPSYYQRANGGFWIAVSDGAVVGTVALLDIGGRAVALRKMFVHADYRGHRGVARQLLDRALAHVAARDIDALYLGTTEQFKAAHRFYEKHGFVAVARDELPPSFPIMAVDSRFYRRSLQR
jgi:N-acetylglutamate synthase-like GNAT family acetyltransferase